MIPYECPKVEAPIIDNLRVLANVHRLYMQINIFPFLQR